MIDHLVHIRQLSSEVTSRMHLLSAHVRALRNAPVPPEPELQARLWTDLELLAVQLRGLAEEMEKARPCKARPPAPALPNRAQPRI